MSQNVWKNFIETHVISNPVFIFQSEKKKLLIIGLKTPRSVPGKKVIKDL